MKRINLLITLLPCLMFCLIFESQAQENNFKKLTDVAYTKNNDDYSVERCKVDVYYPINKKDFTTVVWFHGGGLTGGNKEIPTYLANKGIAVVGVGYRLSPKATVNDIVNDAADAVSWTFENIERLGGNKQKIVLAGHSAGAYLSLMVALNQNYLKQRGLNANQLMGVVSYSAQAITHFTARKEKGLEELHPTVDELSPLYWVRKDVPNILLLTGDRELEMMGRYEENAYLHRMLQLHGNKNVQLYELDGYGHDMAYPAHPLLLQALEKWSK